MNSKIHSQATFCQSIEKIVGTKKISYLDAICEYMEDNHIEPKSIAKLINRNIKDKLEHEATSLNMINRGKKTAKLF